jgi:hypothetical protein
LHIPSQPFSKACTKPHATTDALNHDQGGQQTMRPTKYICLAVLAACALSTDLVAPAAASAERNPEWNVNGSLLTGTEEFLAEALGVQTLYWEFSKPITCTDIHLNPAGNHIIWNDEEPPESLSGGLTLETIVFTGCLYNSKTECKVSTKGKETWGEIQTNPLKSRQVYLSKTAAEEGNVDDAGTLFTPATGEVFVELEYSGKKCPLLDEISVKGAIAAKNIGDPLTEIGSPLSEELSHYLEAPETPIVDTFYNEGGVVVEGENELKGFGIKMKYVGDSRAWLESDANWSIH